MTRFEKLSVWSTTLLVAATGIGYGWTRYLIPADDPFSVINHPLQPFFLKAHILVAPLFLFAIGLITTRHVWRHFRSGRRTARRSGLSAALSLAPMAGTGYLIQVLTGETMLLAMAISHTALGIAYTVAFLAHGWVLRRRAVEREASAAIRKNHPATVPAGQPPTRPSTTSDRTRTPRGRSGRRAAGAPSGPPRIGDGAV